MASTEMTGSCVCGAVTIHASVEDPHVELCHCSTCRNWGGGPFFTVGSATQVLFEGGDHIRRYASSDWAERGFCGDCGTHLFYHLTEGEGFYACPAGLFDAAHDLPLDIEIFVEEKPKHLTGAREQLTGIEVKERFGFS